MASIHQHATPEKFAGKRKRERQKIEREADDDAEKNLKSLIKEAGMTESHNSDSEDEWTGSNESSNDSDKNDASDESGGSDVDTDDALWRTLVKASNGSNETVFDTLIGFYYYFKSGDGKLFQQMFHDVEYAKKSLHMAESKAIEYALRKNENSILQMMKNCEKHRENDLWCLLLRSKPGCRILTGENCACCNGCCVLDKVRIFLEIFYGMKHDDLMKKINRDVDERMFRRTETLKQATEHVFARYRKEILETVDLMHDTIGENEWKRYNDVQNVNREGQWIEHKCT